MCCIAYFMRFCWNAELIILWCTSVCLHFTRSGWRNESSTGKRKAPPERVGPPWVLVGAQRGRHSPQAGPSGAPRLLPVPDLSTLKEFSKILFILQTYSFRIVFSIPLFHGCFVYYSHFSSLSFLCFSHCIPLSIIMCAMVDGISNRKCMYMIYFSIVICR